METRHIKALLESVAAGTLPVADALAKLRILPFEDLEFAHIDHHRALRKGFGEVVYGQDKSAAQIATIAVSYTHLTLPTMSTTCRSRWSPYH